jgi:hypothetical protein
VFAYPCPPDVDRKLVQYVARLPCVEGRPIGARRGTRRLTALRKALFTLAWLHDRSDVQRLSGRLRPLAVHGLPLSGRAAQGALESRA